MGQNKYEGLLAEAMMNEYRRIHEIAADNPFKRPTEVIQSYYDDVEKINRDFKVEVEDIRKHFGNGEVAFKKIDEAIMLKDQKLAESKIETEKQVESWFELYTGNISMKMVESVSDGFTKDFNTLKDMKDIVTAREVWQYVMKYCDNYASIKLLYNYFPFLKEFNNSYYINGETLQGAMSTLKLVYLDSINQGDTLSTQLLLNDNKMFVVGEILKNFVNNEFIVSDEDTIILREFVRQ